MYLKLLCNEDVFKLISKGITYYNFSGAAVALLKSLNSSKVQLNHMTSIIKILEYSFDMHFFFYTVLIYTAISTQEMSIFKN